MVIDASSWGRWSLIVGVAVVLSVAYSLARLVAPILELVVILAVLVPVTVWLFRTRRYLARTVLAANVTRLELIILNSRLQILVQPPISIRHHENATALAAAWSSGEVFGVLPDATGLYRFVAYSLAPFYSFLGPYQFVGEAGIALYSLALGVLSYNIARRITSYRTSVLAAALVLFWPSILYRSVVIQREVIVAAALLAVLWVALRWLERIEPFDVAVFAASVGVLYLLRPENIAIVAVTIAVALALKVRNEPAVLGALAVVLLPLFSYLALNISDFTGVGGALTPATLDRFAQARAHGSAVYLANLHYNSWVDVALYAPIKVVYFFGPLPWQIDSLPGLLAGLSGLGILAVMVLARGGIVMARDRWEEVLIAVAYAGSGILAYAIIELNFGAAFRRRIVFVPVVLIFVAIALSRFSIRISASSNERSAVESSPHSKSPISGGPD
jgi:hypothetical protein